MEVDSHSSCNAFGALEDLVRGLVVKALAWPMIYPFDDAGKRVEEGSARSVMSTRKKAPRIVPGALVVASGMDC